MDKIEWIDGTTKLNKTTMDTFQNNIDSAITETNTKITEVEEEIPDVYSTSEIKTNKVWIDGKPIYRKTFDIGSISGSKTVSHGISNMSNIWLDQSNCFGKTSSGLFIALPYATNESGYIIDIILNGSAILIQQTSQALGSCYITVLYTKTTD